VSTGIAPFAERLLAWFDRHGRHDLPWQHPRQPYRVWLSEVMLQQTQVSTVIPYFERFVARFPDIASLARASEDEVLSLWAGLGYYARGRNLHRAARQVLEQHGGVFPQNFDEVCALPGVGRSTAAAILAQAHGQRHAILDGNVKRVLARHAAVPGWPGAPRVQKRLWSESEARLPHSRLADYTQAVMDLGSQLCTARRPQCSACPVAEDCAAHRAGEVPRYPAAKPRKTRPQREAWLLLIESAQGQWLLQRRPPTGIWGALWSPPVIEAGQDWRSIAQQLGADIEGARALAAVEHAFTHFDLRLHPMHLNYAGTASGHALAESPSQAWIKLASPEDWPALPAPVRKLFDNLRAQPALPLICETPTPCPEPSTASSSAAKPKASTARPTPAPSARASSSRSPRKAGSSGSSTRRA
jgi:A/G-specific adenine glycosylase